MPSWSHEARVRGKALLVRVAGSMKTAWVLLFALSSPCCSAPAPEEHVGSAESVCFKGDPRDVDGAELDPTDWSSRLSARWTVDDGFSEDEFRVLVAASEIWGGSTGSSVVMTIGKVQPGQLWSIRRAPIEPGTPGRTSITARGASMVIDPDILNPCPGALLNVAAHELGHGLGILGHGVTGGVMTSNRVPACEFGGLLPEDLEMFQSSNLGLQ